MANFSGNHFTRELGLKVPIVQGPVGGASCPRLVAAVVNAGALGVLPVWTRPPKTALQMIEQTRALTDRPFAVNLRADLVQLDHIQAALDAGVSMIHLFWGDASASMPPIKSAGAKTLVTVGDREAAKAALDSGADVLVAQGVEAGGHVLGDTPLGELLDAVVALAGDIPVVAAGGLADGKDVADVLNAGASGALLGTRFVATRESCAHGQYKQALIDAGVDSTARSMCFDGGWPSAPHRTLKNSTFEAWSAASRPEAGARPGEGDLVLRFGEMTFPRYSAMHPMEGMTGDMEAAALYAGTGVEKIVDCPSAAELIEELTASLPG